MGGAWQAGLVASLGRENLKSIAYNQPDQSALGMALASASPGAAFDPFGATSSSTVDAIRHAVVSHASYGAGSASLVAKGPLIAASTGSVRLAVGIEHREEKLRHDVMDSMNPDEITSSPRYSRGIDAAFSELSVPLAGPGGTIGQSRLELRLNGRYERYGDFGETSAPGVDVAWLPPRGLRLRASWERSCRAPTLDNLYSKLSMLRQWRPELPGPTHPFRPIRPRPSTPAGRAAGFPSGLPFLLQRPLPQKDALRPT